MLARGKMVQRPFLFQRAQGVSGQLGQEYLVGEVQADWLDEGTDIEDDRIQANRDQLQLEDDELLPFLEWGRRRLAWALPKRLELRKDTLTDGFAIDARTAELFAPFTKGEQEQYMRAAKIFAGFDGMDSDNLFEAMQGLVNAHSDVHIRQMWEDLDRESPNVQEKIWEIIHRFSLIDDRRSHTLVEARLRAINELKQFVREGAAEVPTIHQHIKQNTWLLDPRWHLLGHELDVRNIGIDYTPEVESGIRMDYLFALGQLELSDSEELVVVEIKRALRSNGSTYHANVEDLQRFAGYVSAAHRKALLSTNPPTVKALMVAQGFTANALQQRATIYDQTQNPKMMFRTWDRVIEEAERSHTEWLAIERIRMDDTRR